MEEIDDTLLKYLAQEHIDVNEDIVICISKEVEQMLIESAKKIAGFKISHPMKYRGHILKVHDMPYPVVVMSEASYKQMINKTLKQ